MSKSVLAAAAAVVLTALVTLLPDSGAALAGDPAMNDFTDWTTRRFICNGPISPC